MLYTKGDIDTAELENEEAVELPDLVNREIFRTWARDIFSRLESLCSIQDNSFFRDTL